MKFMPLYKDGYACQHSFLLIESVHAQKKRHALINDRMVFSFNDQAQKRHISGRIADPYKRIM